jgi:hypothetical protein
MDRRQPFRYAPERPTTGKVRVARDSPGIGNPFATIRVNGRQAFDSGLLAIN